METSRASDENAGLEDVLRIAALAAAMRLVCMSNQVGRHQQTLMVSRPPQPATDFDFTGHVPFGFAFTEGHSTPFYVPSGHRFVIEKIAVSCWAAEEIREVQLQTRSRHMFRHMTLWCASELSAQSSNTDESHTILVEGSTVNTLLFSYGAGHRSLQVPPDTYVQLWGYLEPTTAELSC